MPKTSGNLKSPTVAVCSAVMPSPFPLAGGGSLHRDNQRGIELFNDSGWISRNYRIGRVTPYDHGIGCNDAIPTQNQLSARTHNCGSLADSTPSLDSDFASQRSRLFADRHIGILISMAVVHNQHRWSEIDVALQVNQVLGAYPAPGAQTAIVINHDVQVTCSLWNYVEPHILTHHHGIAQLDPAGHCPI